MSIDNEQLVFAEGNDGMASTETVAVATMSNNTKRIIVVDDSNQVCSIDDNDQLVPVTVVNYNGPLHRDDVDQSGNETITVADLQDAGISVNIASSDLAVVTEVVVGQEGNVTKGTVFAEAFAVGVNVDVDGQNCKASNVRLVNRFGNVKCTPVGIEDDNIQYLANKGAGIYDLIINGSVWCTFFAGQE